MPTALIDTQDFDGSDIVAGVGSFVVKDDPIADFAPGAWGGSADVTVDLAERMITPGPIDVHTHLGGRDGLPAPDAAASRRLSEGISMQPFRAVETA